MAELHPSLLDLAAQGDTSLGFRLSSVTLYVVTILVQCAHPRLAVRSYAVGFVAPDHGLESTFPRAQAVSTPDIRVTEPLREQFDELVELRVTKVWRGRRPHPLHMLIPRRTRGQQCTIRGQHVAPVS